MNDRPSAAIEAVKAAPSLGAVFIGWFDVSAPQWSIRLGLLFLVLQIAHLIWRWQRDARRAP